MKTFVMIYWYITFVLLHYSNGDFHLFPIVEELPPSPTTTILSNSTSTPEESPLDDISIQELLFSGMDANEKIEKNIINQIDFLPLGFQGYRESIKLTTNGYIFPKRQIKYDFDKGYIIFHNISVSHWYDYNERDSKFSFSLYCDISTAAKLRVGLPTNIQISANFSIVHPSIESGNEGGITIVIRNSTIMKYENITTYEDVFYNISYTNSKIDLQCDSGLRSGIYNKLETFYNEVESSLGQFFIQQLDTKMEERDLSLISDCSRNQYAESHVGLNKKINLYVIPNVKIETWKGITLSAGPIVIENLGFSFKSIELFVSKNQNPYNNDFYIGQLISRIKTIPLNGKFGWNYYLDDINGDNSTSFFTFSVENIVFENKFSYKEDYGGWEQDFNIHVNKVKIKSFVSNRDNYEVKFAEFVLSEYLKSAISKSLDIALSGKSDNSQRLFVERFFN